LFEAEPSVPIDRGATATDSESKPRAAEDDDRGPPATAFSPPKMPKGGVQSPTQQLMDQPQSEPLQPPTGPQTGGPEGLAPQPADAGRAILASPVAADRENEANLGA